MGKFMNCPRCGWRKCERLRTYRYCSNCNYNSVKDEPYRVPLHIKMMAEEEYKRRKKKWMEKAKEKEKMRNLEIARIKEIQDELDMSKTEENAA